MNKLAPQTVMFFILCILISEGFAQDGWILRKSGTGRKLRSIASGDGQNVVAVGDSGVVTTSSDAGVTWELQKRITWNSPFTGGNPNFSASDTNVNGVTAVTGKIFCAVGDKDSVFRSIDGGHSWHGVVSRAKSDCPLLVPELPLKELRAIDFDTSLKLCIAIG